MYCTKCGSFNPDNATNCSACGAPLQQDQNTQHGYNVQQNHNMNQGYNYNNHQINQNVPNYLVFSILVTVFCCLPLGIAAIIYSTQVDKFLRMGDLNGALEASRKAKNFCLISVVAGFIVGVIYFLTALAGA